MDLHIRRRIAPLVSWTIVMWGTRIWNAADDPDLESPLQAYGTAAFFIIFAVVVARLSVSGKPKLAAPTRWLTRALAVITIIFWVRRMITIAMADHSLGFILVHAVLAIISIAVSVVAHNAVTGPGSSTDTPDPDNPGIQTQPELQPGQ